MKTLVPLTEAAEMLSLGGRKFRELMRQHPDVAERATVVLGARCVRYRASVIRDFGENMKSTAVQNMPRRSVAPNT